MIRADDLGLRLRRWLETHHWQVVGAILAVAVLVPLLVPLPLQVAQVMSLTLLYMILALGLNIVPGFTGLLDLGFVGFYAVGAYTAALLTIHFGWASFWLVLPLATLNGALFGILLGAPTLRLTGDYFAIVTFGFSELVVLLIVNEDWLTAGPRGIRDIASPTVGGGVLAEPWKLDQPLEHYWLLLVLLVVVVTGVRRLERSRTGRAWLAIREDPIAAEACGIDLVGYKVAAFAVSAAIGALAGACYARTVTFISPESFKFFESVLILCMVVLGGMGSVPGVLLGAAVLVPLMELLRTGLADLGTWARANDHAWLANVGSAHFLVLGVLMVAMMRFRPAGLLPRLGTHGSAGHRTRTFSRYSGADAPEDNRHAESPGKHP